MQTFIVNNPVGLVLPRFENDAQQPTDPSDLEFIAWQDDDAEPVHYRYGPDTEFERVAKGEYVVRFTPTKEGVWRWVVSASDVAPISSYFYAKYAPTP